MSYMSGKIKTRTCTKNAENKLKLCYKSTGKEIIGCPRNRWIDQFLRKVDGKGSIGSTSNEFQKLIACL
jgi:hypothetical protein